MRNGRRMPWGKYKFWDLRDVPSEYLKWCTAQDWIMEALGTEIRKELDARSANNANSIPDASMCDQLISTGLRSLSLKFHPDRPGGSHAKMVALNIAADCLREQVRALT